VSRICTTTSATSGSRGAFIIALVWRGSSLAYGGNSADRQRWALWTAICRPVICSWVALPLPYVYGLAYTRANPSDDIYPG